MRAPRKNTGLCLSFEWVSGKEEKPREEDDIEDPSINNENKRVVVEGREKTARDIFNERYGKINALP